MSIVALSFAHWLVIVSILVSLIGGSAYVHDTCMGQTQPNRITWFMWALAPLIGTGAALSADADPWTTTRTFLAGFIPLMVLVASLLNPKSYWKLTLFDFLCGTCSAAALILWLGTDSPKIAILLAAIGDGFAGIPTLRKAWTHPHTETAKTYFLSLIATFLIVPSIPSWTVENVAFQTYLICFNSVILLVLWMRRMSGTTS